VNTRTLGSTGLNVSEIGVGTWQFGGGMESGVGHGWGGINDDESTRVIHVAEDLGINFVDTADIYGNGRSEEVLGRALKGRRDRWIVATKVGLVKKAGEDGQYEDASAEHVVAGVEASLRRLQTDCIDVYQLHAMPTDTQVADTMSALARLRDQGKIRFYGISDDRLEHARTCQAHGELHLVQLAFSMMKAGGHELMEVCGRENIGVIIRSPLGLGLLTGRYFGGQFSFPENDQRARWWDNDWTRFVLRGFAPLADLAREHGCSMTQFALRYVLDRAEVSTVIPGMKTVAQLRDSVAASSLAPIHPEAVERVHAIITRTLETAPPRPA
jgi:aryl-alcohol dehydrogenase-like predicted oxidoreductase